ncbi:carboxylesterase/lipase family protein [Parafilimonas terrae]|uniref:Carboxylic ester hydrolase n=1 Tax=Parafilimonas terrae TaxID=1465490 RepID=A0A1I5YT73_9BACT|nr:carboxylesterase family protein [Parafilimonas terrae]SFQ47382.1 para-nitrobenzyl esterase [Parafilimonas terrae]
MGKYYLFLSLFITAAAVASAQLSNSVPTVKTQNGILEGLDESGIKIFKGVPFAAPPVGEFRWREPQPVQNWAGVRKATKFGPRAMQLPLFGDMNFHSDGMSEDCLYLNIWTPAKTGDEKLPVLVYFYGGGFLAGDGSEPRYAGESMARRGIVAITVNYRLGIFGFFAHPELTKESPHHASGNYGLLDQAAALKWVQQNIAAFGGDPEKITIAGESAGSFSISAQMASPLSKDIIAGAIGESGSLLSLTPTASLADAEKSGAGFASGIKAGTLADLRAMPAEQLLKATASAGFGKFPVTIDGYFFPKSPLAIYEAGEQAHVPLLVGWNSEEMNYKMLMGQDAVTKDNFINAIQKRFGDKAAAILSVYNPATDADVEQVATDLAGDMFIGFSTWKWSDVQSKTGGKPVYRYLYAHPRPAMLTEMGSATAGLAGGVIKDTANSTAPKTPLSKGAVHSAEIEYAMGNLPTNRVYDWQPEDYKVSAIMQSFFVNFIKTGNPNGLGIPEWLAADKSNTVPVMHIDVDTRLERSTKEARYKLIDKDIRQ